MFNPKYTISNKILSQLSQIAEIRALVAKSQLLPQREAFLRRLAIIKMAHSSTSIEGNQLKEYEVAKVDQGKPVNAQQDQITEVKNYLLALRDIDKLAQKKPDFNEADILQVHKTVMNGLVEKEKSGVFRKGQVYIVNVLPNGKEEVAYTPPTAKQVPTLIHDLVTWLKENKEIHPIIRAGLFHYQFETIHPFTDGNGRAGRLLTLLHLYQSGWDFNKVLVLEDYYNTYRKAYYEALQTGTTYKKRQDVDLNNWLEYFVEGFLEEAQKVKDQVTMLSTVANTQFTRTMLDKDELKIVDFAITMGQITSADVAGILDIPQRTAQSKLKRLEDEKIITKMGSGPSTYYIVATS